MINQDTRSRTYRALASATLASGAPEFGAAQGERWRRFLERIGTRSNDFAARLSRARFVYLHRHENATHWLPL